MARSKSSRETPPNAPLRLRVPAALAVAVLGASATVTLSFGGCQDDPIPDPIDAGPIDRRFDAGPEQPASGSDAGGDAAADAGAPLDDADVPDIGDAYEPPPDAAPPH
jgi:hypothetical protein